jgi:hypothetical protein
MACSRHTEQRYGNVITNGKDHHWIRELGAIRKIEHWDEEYKKWTCNGCQALDVIENERNLLKRVCVRTFMTISMSRLSNMGEAS